MRSLNRREFLAWAGKSLLAAGLLPRLYFTRDFLNKLAADPYPLAAVAEGTNEDTPAAILKTALQGIGGIERFVQPGMKVAVKVNATWPYPPHTASSSDPDLIRAMIGLVRDAGAAHILVFDHCSIEPGTADALRVSGIGKLIKEEGVEGIFPDRNNAPLSTYTTIDLPDGKAYQKMSVIKAAVDADVRINMALAKTHNVTKVTMCLKHMMGFLRSPGLLHSSLEQGIADLSTASPMKAELHILEALRVRLPYGNYRVCAGPETDTTNPKVVKRVDQVVAGTDPVLIDAYGCMNYFDMTPEEIPYLIKAFEAGDGVLDVEAAMRDGRLKVFKAGQPVTAPTETAAPTSTSIPAAGANQPTRATSTLAPDGTATPLPTEIPAASNVAPVGLEANTGDAACSATVVDARPFLNLALIPAAGVVAGVGLAAAGLRSRKQGARSDGGHEDEDGKED